MPLKSQAQRRYLWATNPKLAKKFEKETPDNKKLPEKVADHVNDRAAERTDLTDAEVEKMRSLVKSNQGLFRKGSTYSVKVPNRGYFVVGDVGKKRKNHVVKTILGKDMTPPGLTIQENDLKHEKKLLTHSLHKKASLTDFDDVTEKSTPLSAQAFFEPTQELTQTTTSIPSLRPVRTTEFTNSSPRMPRISNGNSMAQRPLGLAKNIFRKITPSSFPSGDAILRNYRTVGTMGAQAIHKAVEHELPSKVANIKAFSSGMAKDAAAKYLGEALILKLLGEKGIPLAEKYNNIGSGLIPHLLKDIPGTEGVHLLKDPAKREFAAKMLSHPESLVQFALPGTPIHMPLTQMLKNELKGVEDYMLPKQKINLVKTPVQLTAGSRKLEKKINFVKTPVQLTAGLGKLASITYRGKTFPGYNQPVASDRAEKKKMVLAKDGDRVKLIHFGQKGYKHNYSEKAKENYLKRSAGITGKHGLTKNDKLSANYWARRELWPQNEPADGTARDKTASYYSAHHVKLARDFVNDEAYKKHLNDRFHTIKRTLKEKGTPSGTGHNRIFFSKDALSEKNIEDLGFVPVTIAIPEAGQTSFRSFRHPDNNYHIHEHGEHWTIHEDAHPAGTMLLKKWVSEKNKKETPVSTSEELAGKNKLLPMRFRKAYNSLEPIKQLVAGIPHVITEGVPGMYYYAKGQLKGVKSMKKRLLTEVDPFTQKALSRLKPINKKPGHKTHENTTNKT